MKKILIIEDDKALAEMYKIRLSQAGYGVKAAHNGREGIAVVGKSKPDLILLDIILPKMDGFDVLKKIKKTPETSDIPVILLTNLSSSEDKELGKKLGALDYLVKAHYTPEQIVERIHDLLND